MMAKVWLISLVVIFTRYFSLSLFFVSVSLSLSLSLSVCLSVCLSLSLSLSLSLPPKDMM